MNKQMISVYIGVGIAVGIFWLSIFVKYYGFVIAKIPL